MIYTLANGVQLNIQTTLMNNWGSGFVTELRIRNLSNVTIDDWSIDLDLADGLTVQSSSHMLFQQNGSTISLSPNAAWLNQLSPNEEGVITFRTNGAVGNFAQDVTPAGFSINDIPFGLGQNPQPTGDIAVSLLTKSTWNGGAWLTVVLQNNSDQAVTDWRLPINLPAGMTFTSSGQLQLVTDADGQTYLTPRQANSSLPAGDTLSFGFVVGGNPALVSGITFGDVTGEIPPTAVIDEITDYNFNTATGVVSFSVAEVLANDFSNDGQPVEITRVWTSAGSGASYIHNGNIQYNSQPAETGMIVLSYEIVNAEGLLDVAQIQFNLPEAPTLSVNDVTVNEADGTATFTVTLDGAMYRDQVSVDFKTRDGSALAGSDYVATSGTLNFTNTTRTQTVTVALVNDSIKELTERFELTLTNAQGARIEDWAGTGTILDDATDTGPIGTTTAGLGLTAALAGEYVVGWTGRINATNNSGAAMTDVYVTIGVQDGMRLVTQSGTNVLQDGAGTIVANHDNRYYTIKVNLDSAKISGQLGDGSFDPGDTINFETYFLGAHFFKPLADRIELAPTDFEIDAPERPYVPLDLTYKGFNTAFFNRAHVTDADVEQSFQQAGQAGANSIAIVTTHFAQNGTASSIYATDYTMTDADLLTAIREAEAQGLNTMLKPHLDLENGQFRGQLNPADKAAFFGRQTDGSYAAGSYGELIMRYAQIAEAEDVEMLLVGTELVTLAKDWGNLPYWTQLIADVRGVYSGEISYATIVGEELFVRFWEQVDKISLDIYPPLTNDTNPSVGELIAGWTEYPMTPRGREAYFNQSVWDLIAGLSEQYGKKVVITETGFRSVDGSSGRPHDFNLSGPVDLQEQADAYEAFFESIVEHAGAFLDGVFLWEWPNEPALADGTIENLAGYSPMNKPALDIITDYFDLL